MSRGIPEDTRLEIKFVADESQEPTLMRWFGLHPAGFTESFPGRWVNNVYFDTYDYLAFRLNTDGASQRH